MSEDTTQAVVTEANASAQPDAAVTDARKDGDDLDAVLKEFDSATTKAVDSKPPEQKSGTDDDPKVILEQLKGALNEHNAVRYRQDMDKTISDIRGDLDPEVFDNDFVESWLDGQARKDPRLAQAWANRQANPKQFERVKETLAKSLKGKFSKMPDAKVTGDREAVTAAVRGASNRAPEQKAPDFSRMTNAEFEAEKAKMFD